MIYRDHFQNYKGYQIPKAQLIIADIPYNLGNYAYASNCDTAGLCKMLKTYSSSLTFAYALVGCCTVN